MNGLFWLSYAVLWLVVVIACVGLIAVYRHLGQQLLATTVGRARQGPAEGTRFPAAVLTDIEGATIALGTRARFLFFAAVGCKTCEAALPALQPFADRHRTRFETVLIVLGTTEEARRMGAELLPSLRVVADSRWKLGAAVRVSSTPYAVLLDDRNIVIAKGMPAHAADFDWFVEQLEVAQGDRPASVEFTTPVESSAS